MTTKGLNAGGMDGNSTGGSKGFVGGILPRCCELIPLIRFVVCCFCIPELKGRTLIFGLSFLLTIWVAFRFSNRLASTPGERFWLFVAAYMLQIGSVAGLLSVIHQLCPAGWLLTQIIMWVTVVHLTGGLGSFDAKRVSVMWRENRAKWREFAASLSPIALVFLACVCLLVIFSGITQLATPIYSGDEKMYHASRALYWIQHRSVFPYVSHNDRQTVSPFGSELFFLWPVLLTKSEAAGRIVFWLAYPCVAVGQYWLLRAMRLSLGIALLGGLILLATPLVATSAIGIKPEVWSALTVLGTAYWAVALSLNPERTQANCFFLGVFAVLSVNVRPTALALLPTVAAVPFCVRAVIPPWLRVRALALGLSSGAALSSLIIPVGFNWALYHHPLGLSALRHVAYADISPVQLYTHAIRFAFLLLEIPDVAAPPSVVARLELAANRGISALGAGAPLPLEDDGPWPGRFSYHLSEKATRFTIWGIAWIPVLGFGVWMLARESLVAWPRINLTAVPLLTLLAAPLLMGVVFGTRWMTNSAAPDRFLVGPYALMLPIGLKLASSYAGNGRRWRALALAIVAFGIYQPLRAAAYDALHSVVSPIADSEADDPFQEALDLIPDGSHILFVGSQNAPDYPLFAPRSGYSNSATSWGRFPFDSRRLQTLIKSEQITHVLIQNDVAVWFHWDPPVGTSEMVKWLSQQPEIRQVALSTPQMRLFQTVSNIRSNERPYATMAAPPSRPFIFVENRFRNQVGIDPTFLATPWPVETLGPPDGFLWIGDGPSLGLEFGIWSREARTADFRFNVAAGPSNAAPDRTVSLLQDRVVVADRRLFRGDTSLVFGVKLHVGRNLLTFFCHDVPTVQHLPNGDPRHLMVLIRKIAVQ